MWNWNTEKIPCQVLSRWLSASGEIQSPEALASNTQL
jgi:hypothetical protein